MALRRSHDIGLVAPAQVDSATGYRYYGAAQAPTGRSIATIKETLEGSHH